MILSGKTNKREVSIIDFTKGNVTRELAGFAAPLFLSSCLQAIYNMAGMLVVGDVVNFMTLPAMGF